MEDLLDQIERASDAGLYYLALIGALALPDMCAAMEHSSGDSNQNRYRTWYEENMLGGYGEPPFGSDPGEAPWLSSLDCWKFRCSMLHQGRGSHKQAPSRRLLFLEPGGGLTLHKGRFNGHENGVMLDISTFVEDMIASVRQWQGKVAGTELYVTNAKSFIRRHPHGFPPFVAGTPVIA